MKTHKHPLSKSSPLLTSLTSLTKLRPPAKPKLKLKLKLKPRSRSRPRLKLKPLSLFIMLPISLCAVVSLNVNAALLATTVNTIQGTKPYLTFDKGKTRAIDTKTLLSLTLSDGTMYTQDNYVSSVSNPIALPVSGQSINDVKLFIPEGEGAIGLNELVGSPYDYWGEDDGDIFKDASGSLSVAITDKSGNSVSRGEPLSPCNAPYEVTLKATDGALSTQYGDPRVTDFNASSVIYYISPKTDTPYACFAKPNLTYNYGTQPEWDGSKGFKLQSLSDPKKNFPRTGFHGAFFDMTIEKATAESIISATGKTITQGGVTAALTAQDTNVVRVTLTGPNNASGGGKFAPSTFTIKSSSTNTIYNFELSKWFVFRPGGAGDYYKAVDYCNTLNYRMPVVTELTNANDPPSWTGGLPGWTIDAAARQIGGGLLAEWGYTTHTYYTDSNFDDFYLYDLWTSTEFGESVRHVRYNTGYTGYYPRKSDDPIILNTRVICVTP